MSQQYHQIYTTVKYQSLHSVNVPRRSWAPANISLMLLGNSPVNSLQPAVDKTKVKEQLANVPYRAQPALARPQEASYTRK